MKITKKVTDRFAANLKRFQAIAVLQKERDVAEADTVTLVKDIMADCFGFDKYAELTSEQQIKGTYVDLAVKIDSKVRYLIEVKAAGVSLNESHIRQAVNYGVTAGIEWVVLTNALEWRLYRVKFGQPVETEEISSFSITDINLRSEEDQRKLFLLCKEGVSSDVMNEFHQHALIFNKFTVAQIILTEPVVYIIRREFKRLFPDVKIEMENITAILSNEVMKREVVDGDKPKETYQKIKKISAKLNKTLEKKKAETESAAAVAEENTPASAPASTSEPAPALASADIEV